MLLFPAIDLKEGQCVRLLKGDMDQATVFNDSPADQAQVFQDAGCGWLHLVDLDGAFAGRPVNAAAVEAILARVTVPVQLGGGIRDLATIERWLDRGVTRIILGTVALHQPDIVRAAAQAFPGRIAVGIDAKAGRVAVEGWAETADITAVDLGRKFEDAGISALIYTDIDRDGMMGGVNVEATVALAQNVSIPVIASGGLSSLADLARLKKAADQAGVALEGAISGRALYDGRLHIGDAVRLLNGEGKLDA